MKRREFFKTAGSGALGSALSSSLLSFLSCQAHKSSLDEYPFPYDPEAFEAAERIVFLNGQEAYVNIIPKEGKSLEIKLYGAEDSELLSKKTPLTYNGVKDSFDLPVSSAISGPKFCYRLEYRESGKRKWKCTPVRRVKTPRSFQDSGRMEILLIGDDHTFDDGDMVKRIVNDPQLKEQRLSGDYVNLFMKELRRNPDYLPHESTDMGKMMSGYCLASTLHQIQRNENPDLIIHLGDTTGIGAGYKWKGLGLKDSDLTDKDYDHIARILWLRVRRMFSSLTPQIPIYLALGNHDGELGFDSARIPAKKYRKKYFKQPGAGQDGAPDESYYPLIWGIKSPGQGCPVFVILDSDGYIRNWPKRPEEWTIGREQKEWFTKALQHETDWKYVFFHHVSGGWARGSDESMLDYCYGRGPLFTFQNYRDECRNPNLVEQVELTRIMMRNGVKANFYGHDHIFHVKEVTDVIGGEQKKMYGICVGSTKHRGELIWYKGNLWKKHYGSYGHFWSESHAFSKKTDFWGPSGYAKLTISRFGTRVEYKRSAYNYQDTNIPPFVEVGEVIHSQVL